jgi:hypothetical protein
MTAAAFARVLKALLPPGKIWQLDDVIENIFLANGDELARVDARAQDLIREADPRTADELLPDFERVLGLEGDGSLGTRRARVVSLLIRRQRFRPADFQQVLAPIFGIPPEDVVVVERTHAQAVALGDEREIFRFFIHPATPGAYDLEAVQEMIDAMKPSHTNGEGIMTSDFLCDDPNSLTDRDLLGV